MSLARSKLEKSNVHFTELTLGGAQIGNHPRPMKRGDAEALIKSAFENGVRSFDTAPLYGYGLSEDIFGKVLKNYPRHEFTLATKVGRLLVPDAIPKSQDKLFPDSYPFKDVFDYSYDGIMQSVAESLKRLQTDYLDIALVHDPDRYTHGDAQPEIMQSFLQPNAEGKSGVDALIELRAKGVIKAIGVGSNNWECCLEVIKKTPEGFVDCIELANRYTLFEQPALAELFPECAKRNIKVMIAGPLNSGILSGNPENKYYNYAEANEDILKRRNLIESICKKHDATILEAALLFLQLDLKNATRPHIVTIVSGMRTPAEVVQNVEILKKSRRLDKLWKELKELKLVDENAFTGKAKRSSMFVAATPVQENTIGDVQASVDRTCCSIL